MSLIELLELQKHYRTVIIDSRGPSYMIFGWLQTNKTTESEFCQSADVHPNKSRAERCSVGCSGYLDESAE